MKNNLFIVSKYATAYLLYLGAAIFVFWVFDFEVLSFVSLVLLLGVLYVFRNPERELQDYSEACIVSPCDGKVLAIEELEENAEYRYKIEIETSWSDVGVLRFAMNGTVEAYTRRNGTGLAKTSKLFNDLNERCAYTLQNSAGKRVHVTHQLERSCFGLYEELKGLKTALKAKRYGFALPTLTTVYLPKDVRLNIHVNQQLRAAEDSLAYFS